MVFPVWALATQPQPLAGRWGAASSHSPSRSPGGRRGQWRGWLRLKCPSAFLTSLPLSVWRGPPSCSVPDSLFPPQWLKSDIWRAGFGEEREGSAEWVLGSGAVNSSERWLLSPLPRGLMVPLCLPL